MKSVVLYLHMHQPLRIKQYSIFSVGHDHDYWTEKDWYAGPNNERIFKKVTEKSYRPMLAKLEKCLVDYPGFKFSISITGTFIEQAQKWAPDLIATLQRLAKTGRMEIAGETYYHSLAFFFDKQEFEDQVRKHQDTIRELFGLETKIFRNTEFSYNNDLARWADEYGFKGILAEGWDKILEGRTPNAVYRPEGCKNIKLLMKNYDLSDDVAFRFPDKTWNEWPLTAEKFVNWVSEAADEGPIVDLFMDFETFGENIWKDTGIFGFFDEFIKRWDEAEGTSFMTLSEACDSYEPAGEISVPWTVTWADTERDLSAWLGNSIQHEAMKALYELKDKVFAIGDPKLIDDWRHLQTSDHPYYMCTKYFNDGGVHAYFSPYDSPFDAFQYFMNVIRDMRLRVDPEAKDGESATLPKPEAVTIDKIDE